MRASHVAAAALTGALSVGLTAPAALADQPSGQVEASPHAVHPGRTVWLSTEACRPGEGPAWVRVVVDGVSHKVWLKHHTGEGLTGSFWVPQDADPGRYSVEGRCDDGPEIEGSFWVVARSPEGSVHAGSGGSIAGPSMTEAAGGSALALAGGLLGLTAVRRRRASTRS